MRLIPYYRVKYHGEFCEAGKSVEIDPNDIEEMQQHGVLVPDKPVTPPAAEPKKPGRPRKAVTAHDEGQPVKAEAQDAGN